MGGKFPVRWWKEIWLCKGAHQLPCSGGNRKEQLPLRAATLSKSPARVRPGGRNVLGCAWDRVRNRGKGPSSISVGFLRCLPPSLPSDTGERAIVEPLAKDQIESKRHWGKTGLVHEGRWQPRHRQTNLMDPELRGQSHTYTELPAVGTLANDARRDPAAAGDALCHSGVLIGRASLGFPQQTQTTTQPVPPAGAFLCCRSSPAQE